MATPPDNAPPSTPNSPIWETMAPILAFLVVNRLAGLRWAVAVASALSAKVVIGRKRRGQPLGRFAPLLTVAIIARGVAGIATGSENVYFGLGIAAKYLAALALLGSVLLRRPLAAVAAPFVLSRTEVLAQHPAWRSAMSQITAIGGLYYAATASLDTWLLRRSSVEGFVLLRFLANWPLSTAAIVGAWLVADRRLQAIEGGAPVSTLLQEYWGSRIGSI